MNRTTGRKRTKEVSLRARIFAIGGDGVGPEVTMEAVRVLEAVAKRYRHKFEVVYGYLGGQSIDKFGQPLTPTTMNLALGADAVMLGAVGGEKWQEMELGKRPEVGLLQLRKNLGLFINLRPVKVYPQLIDCSPLKREVVENTDFIIVRELTGGLYFGKPKRRVRNARGQRALDTMSYTEKQIVRVAKVAFELAASRKRRRVHSVDKMNVLETSRLWHDVVADLANDYPDVRLEHLLVDNAAMRIITTPRDFDVIVTENTFGDILSDEAAALTGSLGMMPSASLSVSPYSGGTRRRPGLYEPVHGSAPEMAGSNIANPSAAILSVAMMLEYSLRLKREADAVVEALTSVLTDGYVTEDISASSKSIVTTSQMGTLVAERIGE